MNEIGIYENRKVFWVDYVDLLKGEMPKSNWICLAITNKEKPSLEKFETFTRQSIQNNILEFKGFGIWGELLHDCFDETIVEMEIFENHSKTDIMTTWHSKESLVDTFWQCFFATTLSETVDYNNLQIICTDLDEINRVAELKGYLDRFENGWLPN